MVLHERGNGYTEGFDRRLLFQHLLESAYHFRLGHAADRLGRRASEVVWKFADFSLYCIFACAMHRSTSVAGGAGGWRDFL
jgi:hypothetical protein